MKDCFGYVEIYAYSIGDIILNGTVRLLVVNPEQRMTDDQDPVTTNPLTEPESPASPGTSNDGSTETDEYQLTEIARGRMLCILHGRVCYRRLTIIGENEWVCPDERHRKPTRPT